MNPNINKQNPNNYPKLKRITETTDIKTLNQTIQITTKGLHVFLLESSHPSSSRESRDHILSTNIHIINLTNEAFSFKLQIHLSFFLSSKAQTVFQRLDVSLPTWSSNLASIHSRCESKRAERLTG